MPQNFKVVGVEEGHRTWQSKQGGEMYSYAIEIADQNGQTHQVEWSRKPTSPAPTVGTDLEGHIEASGNNYPDKFKQAQGSGGGGYGGGGRGNDPETIARISRSHSQEMALRMIAATGNAQGLPVDNRETVGAYLNNVVRPLTDFFDADKKQAGDKAKAS